jgi:hypothetical protein
MLAIQDEQGRYGNAREPQPHMSSVGLKVSNKGNLDWLLFALSASNKDFIKHLIVVDGASPSVNLSEFQS